MLNNGFFSKVADWFRHMTFWKSVFLVLVAA